MNMKIAPILSESEEEPDNSQFAIFSTFRFLLLFALAVCVSGDALYFTYITLQQVVISDMS